MKAIIAIAFALCIVSLNAVGSTSFRENRDHETVNRLRKIQTDSFGKKLLKTVSIELQTSDRVDTVIGVINDLQTELRRQQVVEDEDFQELSTRYTETIDKQVQGIAESEAQIKDYVDRKADEVQKLHGLEADRETLLAEEATLNQFLETLGNSRIREAEEHATRVADQEQIVQGLEAVIQLLGGDAEGDDNQNYDRESLRNVITKLQEVLTGVEQSIDSDKASEAVAVGKHTDFVGKAETRLGEIARDVADLDEQISTSKYTIAGYEAGIVAEEAKIENYINVRDENQGLLNALIINFNNNKAVRDGQLALCEEVIQILQTRLTAVRQYLPDVAAAAF